MLSQVVQDQVFQAFSQLSMQDEVFLFDSAPPRKMRGALSYARLEPGEIILVIYDDTVFGSAKNGFMLTTKRVYSRPQLESAEMVDLSQVTRFTKESGWLSANIYAENPVGRVKLEVTLAKNGGYCEQLLTALNAVLPTLNPAAGAPALDLSTLPPPQPVLPAQCPGCGAPGQVRVCEYCGCAV